MRNFIIFGLLSAVSANIFALTTQSFRDNTDVSVTLSQSNYNRLVVKDDKIIQAHFPEGAMAIKNEADGSLYVMLGATTPFTLFLTTESGHHFSATVGSEEALGKTIEFVPQTPLLATKTSRPIGLSSNLPEATTIKTLLTSMVSNTKLPGYDVKNHFGLVQRLNQGLMLTPKKTFNGIALKGEILSLYNGGKLPIDLEEKWFAANGVKAISLSATTLAPKQSALIYRVSENSHG